MMHGTLIELRRGLLRSGYSPLPLIGKAPALKEWQKRINTSEGDLQIWSKVYPTAANTGVLTRLVPALDLDLLNAGATAAAEEYVRERYEEGGYVLTRIGRAPKRAILFRTEEPFPKIIATLVAPNGSTEKIEFLADGQQVACFGIHPDTQLPYSWHKNAPGEIARDDLPYIREAEALALVRELAEMLVADFGYACAPERPHRKKSGADTGKAYDGAADWQYLVDRIRAGEALHDSLRDLAAKLVTSGMVAGAVVNFLQGLMESSAAPRDERWQERLNEIPRLVDGAEDKFRGHPPEQDSTRADDGLTALDVCAWHNQPVPERDWVVRDRIIRRNVASLSGEGGVGKSILVMQLAVAHVIGGDWLFSLPEKGPAIYFNAEDDEQELHHRLAAAVRHAGCGFNDLSGLHLITRAGRDAVLGAPDRNGIIRPTPLFAALHSKACSIKPQVVIVDTAADIFAGNENDRAQVRQFIGLLRGLAIDANCGVLVVSHPSQTGITSGSGTSGSTGWHNSVRSRLYFKAATDDSDDAPKTGVRELVIKKNNYGPSGEIIRLYYDGGVFKTVSSPSSLERAAAEQKAEHLFMTLFDRLADQGRTFSPSRNSPENYPPKVFATHPDGKGTGSKAFEEAMQRLLDAGTIRIETVGKPSKPQKQVVRT